MKKRATPTERMVVRIFREAGATLRPNVFLRDMNVDVSAVEVLAQDLPCFGGVQLAVDITLRSALSSEGEAHLDAADIDGAVLLKARADKETQHPELVRSGRCRLVVLAIETGGRWRRTCPGALAALPSKGARSSTVCAHPSVAHVGAQMDTHACRHVTWCTTGGEAPPDPR